MDKKDFVIADIETGKLNALVKNIMRQTGVDEPNEAVRLINSEEWIVKARPWREKDGVIYFNITSDGTPGYLWYERLKINRFNYTDYLDRVGERILKSENFKPTCGVITGVAVLRGVLFEDKLRRTERIWDEGNNLKLGPLNMEEACIIRGMFTDEELDAMGLKCIVSMVLHFGKVGTDNPDPTLDRWQRGHYCQLGTNCGIPIGAWPRKDGFAFAVSRVGAN